MAVADPAGVLARIPELEGLVDYARVRRAIERGDLLGLYRALWWGHRMGRLAKHRDIVRSLLARRRLFIAPIGSAPKLFTYNGVGTTAYGRTDFDSNDNTYILTQWVAFVFVPLFPLAQFLVRDAAGSGTRRSWSFIGKVPFGPVVYAWNRLLALAAVASVVVGVFSVWRSSRFHEIHVVNGLAIPVRATIAGQTVEVAPQSHVAMTVRVGTQPVAVARLDGQSVESAEIDVPRGRDVVCWNVLGSAPIFHQTVVYGPAGADNDAHSDFSVGCGERRLVYEKVTDLWVEPPKEVTVSDSAKTSARGNVDLARGGVRNCIGYLADKTRFKEAADLAQRAAELSDFDDSATDLAASMIEQASGGEASLAWVHRALTARPSSLELHRSYQSYATRAGKRAEVLPEYRARYAREGDSADSGYLLARLETPSEAVGILDNLVHRFPQHIASRRAHAFNEYQLRHFDQALESWSVLRKLAPEEWAEQLPLETRAMVAVGRAKDALREVESEFAAKESDQAGLAGLYAEIAGGNGLDGEVLFAKLKDEVPPARTIWLHVAAGQKIGADALSKIDEPMLHEASEIILAARAAPDDALARVARGSAGALRALVEPVWTLLYAEAVRREPDGAASKALARASRFGLAETQSVEAFLRTGKSDAELDEASFEVRAAVQYIRSRVPTLPAAERQGLVAHARQDDLLHGAVTAAIDGWPH